MRGLAMHERIRHRRQTVAQADARRRRRRAASLAGIAALLIAAALIARSPLLAVEEVDVEGVSGERADEVRVAAGVRVGDNLLAIDLGRAAGGVEALAWVAEAEARRVPPSAVVVHVTPREPIAVVRVRDAAWLLDADGVVVAGGAREHLPIIEAPEASLPPIGAEATDAAVRNAIAVHAQLPLPLRGAVERYEAESVLGLRLRLTGSGDDELWVRFGAAEEVEAKGRAIGLLLAELDRREQTGAGDGGAPDGTLPDIAELDVRAPNNPVLVPQGTP